MDMATDAALIAPSYPPPSYGTFSWSDFPEPRRRRSGNACIRVVGALFAVLGLGFAAVIVVFMVASWRCEYQKMLRPDLFCLERRRMAGLKVRAWVSWIAA
jgi:hypothetical protein